MLANAMLVLNFESNLAFESQHLLHHLSETGVKNWVSLAEGAREELGWLTTHARKEAMALTVREALRVGKISYSEFFFSVHDERARGQASTWFGIEEFFRHHRTAKIAFWSPKENVYRKAWVCVIIAQTHMHIHTAYGISTCPKTDMSFFVAPQWDAGRRVYFLPASADCHKNLLRKSKIQHIFTAIGLIAR